MPPYVGIKQCCDLCVHLSVRLFHGSVVHFRDYTYIRMLIGNPVLEGSATAFQNPIISCLI